ncbi:unnamed protein product, partial [Laminaria digitata]
EADAAVSTAARRQARHAETTRHELSVAEDAVIDAAKAVNIIRGELARAKEEREHTDFRDADLRIAELEGALVAKEREHADFREGVQGRLEKLNAAFEEENGESGAQ